MVLFKYIHMCYEMNKSKFSLAIQILRQPQRSQMHLPPIIETPFFEKQPFPNYFVNYNNVIFKIEDCKIRKHQPPVLLNLFKDIQISKR